MILPLMTSRRFAPLFWCQALSAFNDNFIKNVLIILILFGVGSAAPSPHAGILITISGSLLILPALLLSGIGGEWADRYDKSLIAQRIRAAEIIVASVAGVGFVLHSIPILMAAVFGLGCVVALFSPIKYGILPDHLRAEELPAGNALVEGGTFLSILLGTVAGGLAMHMTGDTRIVAVLMVLLAIVCWLAALAIPPTTEAAPGLRIDPNILRSTWKLIAALRGNQKVRNGTIAVAWFWMIGFLILSLVPPLAKDVFGGGQELVTLFLTAFSIGIGGGSLLAAKLSAGRLVLSLAPIGSVLMGVFGLDVAYLAASATRSADALSFTEFLGTSAGAFFTIDLLLMAVGAGLFAVPVFTAVQVWADRDQRARVVAGTNVATAVFIVAAAGILAALQLADISTATLLFWLAVLNIAAAVLFWWLLDIPLLRDITLLLFRIFYGLKVKGLAHANIPSAQRIIAINHVSFLDAPLMLALLDINPVFAIDHAIAKAWWVKPFLKLARVYPLDPTKPMATRALIQAVKSGETLVIFPEGRLTVTGSLMKIYDGAGLIADKSHASIIPVRIDGLERTPFSRLPRTKVNRKLFPRVRVTFMPAQTLAVPPDLRGKKRRQAAGAALYDVMSDLIFRTTPTDMTVFEAFAQSTQHFHKRRAILEDPLSGALTHRKALIRTAILADKLADLTKPGEHVGFLLPNSSSSVLTYFALQSIGCVPAMLNYTSGSANILAACGTAQVKAIVSSRAFVERARLQSLVAALAPVVDFIWLETIRDHVTGFDKLKAFLRAGQARSNATPDDTAAILFTSGSEGSPKSVVLSHRNILSNCAQVGARIDFGPGDILFNVLPIFHSFGMTGGMILPLISGVKLYLYPSPLHYRIIPELVYSTNATVLFGTDTFLMGYAKTANPYDFRSLRYVIAGAEPVKPETRRIYNEKFGLRVLEGYGVTETSPVLAVNTPMFHRSGTVGRVLPGLEARLEPVPGIEEGGRLFVKGPNVMKGYMTHEKPGVLQPPPDGWHDTGDIVAIDQDGFVTIKGRAKRFAKVAGEMVSLGAVESLLADLFPEVPFAIVVLPDPRKGERLILVTAGRDVTRGELSAHLKAKGATELMIPAQVVSVDEIPLLGSGKIDHVKLQEIVQARHDGNEAHA